jgi:hypothetical protein
MGVSLKTEQRRSHTAVAGFGPRVRRAEGCRETDSPFHFATTLNGFVKGRHLGSLLSPE